jgi:hypothetical protein
MLPAINRSEATKGTGDAAGHVPDIHRPEIIRGVLERVLATSNVFGRGRQAVRVRGIPPAT